MLELNQKMHRGHTGLVNSTHALERNMCQSHRPLCRARLSPMSSVYVILQACRRLLCNFRTCNAHRWAVPRCIFRTGTGTVGTLEKSTGTAVPIFFFSIFRRYSVLLQNLL